MKACKKYFILLGMLGFLLIGSAVSYAKFGVADPLSTANGILQVILTDTQYVLIQEYPQVIVAKPEVSLAAYMEQYGYSPDSSEQMGAVCVYTTHSSQETILYSENRYFARWSWQE